MAQRIEEDSIGKIKIENDRLYGINTQRAVNNFHLTVNKTNIELIRQMAKIKYAAAIANEKVGRISHETAQAIKEAAEEIIAGDFDDQFVVPEIQGGAGTSTNMNVNEVIANRGLNILGYNSGDYEHLSPQDDVNAGQSTNDVYPSSGKLAILEKSKTLDAALDHMIAELDKKAEEFAKIKKIGRTQLQDAVPTTLGNTFKAYSNSMKRCKLQLNKSMNELWELNLGGTAIGTGVNAAKGYKEYLYSELRKIYNVNVHPADDLIDSTQNLDAYVRVSGSLKALAVAISKMSHDLRLLSSGPRAGF
jgi:Aspartate ammonia-lyase